MCVVEVQPSVMVSWICELSRHLVVLTGFLHVYEEMEKAQAAMVRLMVKAKEAAGPSGSQGSHCPRLVRRHLLSFRSQIL